MPDTALLITDAIRARDPIAAWYDSTTGTTIMSALKPDGSTSFYHYIHQSQRLWESVSGFAPYGAPVNDTHNTTRMTILAAGGPRPGQPVFAVAGHNSTLQTRACEQAGKVGAMAAIVNPGINTATYPFLAQLNNTAKTLYVFYRWVTFGTPNQWFQGFKTSTDGGLTWSANTTFLVSDDGGNLHRPYFAYAHVPGTSRVDFVCTRGHTNEVTDNALYSGYFTVDAAGARSWFKSDGTAIGSGDSALPLDITDITNIDGPTAGTNFLHVDLAHVEGVLTLLYTRMTPYDDATSHEFYLTKLVAGAWTTPELIVAAGESGTTPHEQYVNAWHITGGGCLDPNDADAVYLSRKYGSGDFRLEKWTKSGTWSKTVDISGNTGNMNVDPFFVRNAPTTQIMYCRGTISADTTWDMDIYTYPALPVRSAPTVARIKPTVGAWQAGFAPPGVKSYFPIIEGTGTTLQDFVPGNVHAGTFVGTPDWQVGDYGPELNGFTTSDYVNCLFSTQDIGLTFPFWVAVFIHFTGTVQGEPITWGNSTSDTPWIRVIANAGAVGGRVSYLGRASSGTGFDFNSSTPASNDGEPTLIQGVSWSASNHVMYRNGIEHARAATTPILSPLPTLTRMTIGMLGRIGGLVPFTGTVIAAAHGEGGVPDPLELKEDWMMGVFAAIRPSDSRGAYRTGTNMLQSGIKSGGIL